jgi:hypothetical protein
MKKMIYLFILLLLIIQYASAVNIIIDDKWKAGQIEKIKVETEVSYDNSYVIIMDSEKNVVSEGKMNNSVENIYNYQYQVPSNIINETYSVYLNLYSAWYGNYVKTFQIDTEPLTFFEKIWLVLKTNLPFL